MDKKIKGHSDIIGNAVADVLATQASKLINNDTDDAWI